MSKNNGEVLLAGAAEIDITPPVGTMLAGGLEPRPAIGTEDPLYVKSIVLESKGEKLAYVIFDLAMLARQEGGLGVELASRKTGILPEHIVWAASHTHTGPYTLIKSAEDTNVNRKWLASIPEKMAECVAAADMAKKPADFSRLRTFHYGLAMNRRVRFKNGAAYNTWLLNNAPDGMQSVGTAGPVDPEIGILAFDDRQGNPIAAMFHFTLHCETNFGPRFSGDYPAVVAARLRERFGPQMVTLFMPGAFGDINKTGGSHRQIGDALAEKIIEAMDKRKPEAKPVTLAAAKCEITAARKDLNANHEERISNSGWSPESQEYFRRELEYLRREGKKEDLSLLQAWRIGETGFASLPGEIFVEWGLKIKRESPFPFTYPVELGGDHLGYLVTEQAWQEGGYEPLFTRGNRTAPGSVGLMVEKVLEMLRELYKK